MPLALWLLAAGGLFGATNLAGPDEIPPLRPARGELPPTLWEQYGLWMVAGGVLLLGLVCGAVWYLSRPKAVVALPPEVAAREALEGLRQKAEDGALLSRVSQVLRRYVASAFALEPGELTTAEFCRAMAGRRQIGPELTAALSEFLRECDERKFSPPAPVPPLGAVAQALKLIEQAQDRRAAQAAGQPLKGPASGPPKAGAEQQTAS